MSFNMPEFKAPDFNLEKYKIMPNVKIKKKKKDKVAPDNFFLTTHMPTFYKYNDKWYLPERNSLNCVAVVEDGEVNIKELREIKKGDKVISGSSIDGSEGVLVYKEGFDESVYYKSGSAVETSFSETYEKLFALMEYEKQNKGYIVWVLGPSVVFDFDTRNALTKLCQNGYINCLLGGNAICTHDLEAGYLNTALGQNIYTQENAPMGHYNHLDLLNEVKTAGSIKNLIDQDKVMDGIIKTMVEMDVPFVLSGSIRDDGPLPEVYAETEQALNKTKEYLNKATLIIGVATMLHTLSVANMASGYRVRQDGKVTPVYMYCVDVTENVANKVAAARENMAFTPVITNVQSFCVNLERNLIEKDTKHKKEVM